jgi:membrane protein required for colicin V production
MKIWEQIGVVDTISLAVLTLFLIRGIWKGFVWQIAGLATVIGGLYAAQAFAPHIAPTLRGWFPVLERQANADLITSYFAIFVGVMIVVLILAKLFKGLLDRLQLSGYDRLFGGMFGVLKAAVLIVVCVSVLSMFDWPAVNERIAQAETGRIARQAIEKAGPLFPEEVQERVRETMDSLERFSESEEERTPR